MAKITLKTSKNVTPMIYSYSTPEVARHNGWTKIGYTEHDVEKRIGQQMNTGDILWKLEWKGAALYDDGSYEAFTDHDFHAYLRKNGVEQEKGKKNEWFHISGPDSKSMFYDFRSSRGADEMPEVVPYALRKEQEEAVSKTLEYANHSEDAEFLWNAKPRFGKTLSVYEFIRRMGAFKVLIVTNRPAIANSWYSDYIKFLGRDSGYLFVSDTDSLKGRLGVVARDSYGAIRTPDGGLYKRIQFVSLQDLKGSVYFGGQYDKLKEVRDLEWDVLVIDEAHEGVDTYKTDVAFDRITRKFTLHLSGTPFKALANDKFPEVAIYNWTYADEQRAKAEWDETSEEENPYETLPKMNLFTYQMSEIVKEELERGIEIQGETEEYAFDLNEFFRVDGLGRFIYNSSVNRFLDALTTQEKFPFSTEALRKEIKHSFWMLNRVESARALAKKLKEHPVFSEYEIILAAGDGKLDNEFETAKSFDRVTEAIKTHEKTITLSVGQLTTGVTIPEWTAVLMLSNISSPSLYMQAAFRSQNPCLFQENGKFYRKENAYVFDFDPARTLTIFEQFANDLTTDTAAGHGDLETRTKHIKELLNFFPVIGEDESGEMIALDAEKVLTIPRKIKSQEVVRRGFMSNYLFQNISMIFSAPKEVVDIITQFTPVAEPRAKISITDETKEQLSLDEEGNVVLDDDYIIGQASEIFGDKIFGATEDEIGNCIRNDEEEKAPTTVDKLKEHFKAHTVEGIINTAAEKYGEDMKASDKRQVKSMLTNGGERIIDKTFSDYQIEQKVLETERTNALKDRFNSGKSEEEINREFDEKQQKALDDLQDHMTEAIREFVGTATKEVVETVETNIKKREKASIEDTVRDHLRGFSRTIPSFLMAYGNDSVTLATFDEIIPNQVFVEVTSITLDQFRFLRDGGSYTDEETGEEKEFKGHLFDEVVFDDSVKEFLRLKKKLADYFDEKAIEDIFDYIPPQKTNQIFTPKDVVKRMADMLEEENPGCFDDAEKTFLDPYMKSGMYITEIVKRLYQSEKMKEQFPDNKERLRHIFAEQVYGLAPTEIIYKIATSYILGFSDEIEIEKHNLRLADSLPYAKEGRLQELLEELFGNQLNEK